MNTTKTMIAVVVLMLVGACEQPPTEEVGGAATACAPSEGVVSFRDGTVLDCSNPAATVTCAANDAACLCKRLTGDETQTSCTPCALQYPCTADCQCVADHGAGWACVVASQGAAGAAMHDGCAQM